MKTSSESKNFMRISLPVVLLTMVGCFALGLVIAHFRPTEAQPSAALPQAKPAPTQPVASAAATRPEAEPAAASATDPTTQETVEVHQAKATPIASSVMARNPAEVTTTPSPPVNPPRLVLETLEDFGHSVKGAPLRAYILGEGSNVTVVFGDFHGNERSVPGVVDKLHDYLRQHPDEWLNCRVILVPYANPDGWAASTRVNAHGVDINRNFPGTWKAVGRAARNYPGPRAASEPETRAIMELVTRYKPKKIVSIHQPLHMLNWTGQPGLDLAKAMQQCDHYSVSDDVGYATPGSFGDYCGNHHIAIVTLEMPGSGVPACWGQNRDALLAAINLQL